MDEDEIFPDGLACPSCERVGGLRPGSDDPEGSTVVCDLCGSTFVEDPGGEGGAEVVIEEKPEGPGPVVACPACGTPTDDRDGFVSAGEVMRECPECGAEFAAGAEIPVPNPDPGDDDDGDGGDPEDPGGDEDGDPEDDDEGEEADGE